MICIRRWRVSATVTAFGAALLAGGCASTEGVRYGEVSATPGAYAPRAQPLSIGEIVAAIRAGQPQDALAADIRERGLPAPATEADVDLLLQNGAGGEVIESVRAASASVAAGAAPVAPPVVVAPAPVTVVPGYYGWYPWVPFSFGLWWYDVPYRHPSWHYRPPPGTYRPAPPIQPAPVRPAPPQGEGPRSFVPGAGPGTSPGRTSPGGRQLKPVR